MQSWKPAKNFTAVMGVDRTVDHSPASVRFHVSVDGKDVFATDVTRAVPLRRPSRCR